MTAKGDISLNSDQKFILTLIKSCLTGEQVDQSTVTDFSSNAINIIHTQRLDYLVKTACDKNGIEVPEEIKTAAAETMLLLARQFADADAVFKAFDEARIPYIPLKGLRVINLYPSKLLRFMNDADFLIRESDIPTAIHIMQSHGYIMFGEVSHHFGFSRNTTEIEIHKELFGHRHEQLRKHFENVWEHAIQDASGVWHMNPEQEYLYVFCHYAKHYLEGDPKIYQLIDLYLLASTCNMDKVMLKAEQMHMERFLSNTLLLLECWFGEGQPNDAVSAMNRTIFNRTEEDAYSRSLQILLGKQANDSHSKTSTALRIMLRKIFPPKSSIAFTFPDKTITPLNYPFYYVRRWGVVLFSSKYRMKRESFKKAITNSSIDYSNELTSVGLEDWKDEQVPAD